MIHLEKANLDHVRAMSCKIRQADIDEFAAGYSKTPELAMIQGIGVSTHSWAGVCDGRVIAVAGLFPLSIMGDTARPWMVGSRDLEKPWVTRQFLQTSKHALRFMISLYPHLENYVDARNTVAIRWLKWLGFQFHDPQPYGPMGLPFHRFEMRRDHV